MCPTIAKWGCGCDISAYCLHSCLQTALTSSFQLQFVYCLKFWTPDFPSFETRYSMHNLSSRKCSKMCPTEVRLQHFRSWCAGSSSNGHNFFVSTPNCVPFKALDFWLPDIWNEIWYAWNELQKVLQNVSNGGCGCNISIHGVRAEGF